MTGRCAQTHRQTDIERTHYLRHSLRSLGGDKTSGIVITDSEDYESKANARLRDINVYIGDASL